MKELTMKEIQTRHHEILVELDRMDELKEKEQREFTPEEGAKYDNLMREDNRLHNMLEHMLTGKQLEQYREHKSKNVQLREYLKECIEKRANASTILMNPVTSGGDQNTVANLEASGAIPYTINEIIDTKVAGLELPADLALVTGVIGNEVWPYSTNDVKFTIAGEVQKVGEQALAFDKIQAIPQRVAASVAVSQRAIDNAAFDLLGFIAYKMRKGWAMTLALHVYGHGEYNKFIGAFGAVEVEELTLDENIGKNLAKKAAEMYDLGFEGIPYFTMDKVTEVDLQFTKRLPNSAGDSTVVEDGRCVGYPYTVSPYIDYVIASDGTAAKETDRYIGIGHYGYLALQQHGEMRFNVDAFSADVFDRGSIVIGMSTDMSLTELSSKVNGKQGGPQAFKLLKLVEPASSSEL